MFVQIASKYAANVAVTKDGQRVNGKSIMGLLTLGAQKGDGITLEVDGDGAEVLAGELEGLLKTD
jgi:phosphocarrier protein